MGIATTTYRWLLDLNHSHSIFSGARNILDLGPQDISSGIEFSRHLLDSTIDIAPNELFFSKHLYQKFGVREYYALDIFDKRANIKEDLNLPIESIHKFDIVTNFGTMEHVFNVSICLENIHNLTRDGGIMLHCVPTSLGYDHGYYNFHQSLFKDIALANNYEVIDIRYVPIEGVQHIVGLHKIRANPDLIGWSLKSINFTDVSWMKRRQAILSARLLPIKIKLLTSPQFLFECLRSKNFRNHIFNGDMIFVAFKKNGIADFQFPIQGKFRKLENLDSWGGN